MRSRRAGRALTRQQPVGSVDNVVCFLSRLFVGAIFYDCHVGGGQTYICDVFFTLPRLARAILAVPSLFLPWRRGWERSSRRTGLWSNIEHRRLRLSDIFLWVSCVVIFSSACHVSTHVCFFTIPLLPGMSTRNRATPARCAGASTVSSLQRSEFFTN